MPTQTPITPERRIVHQCWATSRMRGKAEPNSMNFGRAIRSLMTVSTSEKPKAPTSTGISEKPPERSRLPKVNRS
jgi:hypothetical protein